MSLWQAIPHKWQKATKDSILLWVELNLDRHVLRHIIAIRKNMKASKEPSERRTSSNQQKEGKNSLQVDL